LQASLIVELFLLHRFRVRFNHDPFGVLAALADQPRPSAGTAANHDVSVPTAALSVQGDRKLETIDRIAK
jgi:hypothetical protein